MDTACLRIKFTPLLKGSEKLNSKCCLEIVPEVSYIQNFDKLIWKAETNYIEYIIPMKYKIILKKHNTVENTDEVVKTYHSCVDLLLSTSKSNYDLASGDVSRMISDTFIVSKINKKDYFTHNLVDFNEISQSGTATYETITTLDLKDLTIEETEDETINDGTRKSSPQQCHKDKVGLIFCDKFTNTESVSAAYSHDIDADWTDKKKSGPDPKRMLSVAPMYSVNTQNTAESIVSKAITCNIHNSQAQLVKVVNTRSDLYNEFQITTMISKWDHTSRSSIKDVLYTTSRSSPENRIAHYIKYMEAELLPLNKFLDKLITKCSMLGVNKNRYISEKTSNLNLVLYKSVSRCKNNTVESCEKSVSNRAVYSIVFNE